MAASSSGPSAVTRTRWPFETPLLMTAMIDFASIGVAPSRSRFSSVIFDPEAGGGLHEHRGGPRVEAAGVADGLFGAAHGPSVPQRRVAGGVAAAASRRAAAGRSRPSRRGSSPRRGPTSSSASVRRTVLAASNGTPTAPSQSEPSATCVGADPVHGIGDRARDPRRVRAAAGGVPEPDPDEAAGRGDPRELRVGQVARVVEHAADAGVRRDDGLGGQRERVVDRPRRRVGDVEQHAARLHPPRAARGRGP